MLTRIAVPTSFSAVTTTPADTNVAVIPTGYKYVTAVVVYAEESNTGDVYIGGAGVTSSTGIPIGPGESFSLSVDGTGVIEKIKSADLYVQSATDTNKVRVFALGAE